MARLSNVIGAPFEKYIIDQLKVRTEKSTTDNRSADEILYIANSAAWIRLTSSVSVDSSVYSTLGVPYTGVDDLAKNWILQGGTSKIGNNNTLEQRFGLGPDGAYGLGGIQNQGYRPMPGITSVNVETQGKLGSLRYATVSFKVWSLDQLNIMDALYFRLGFSMLLEWGHVSYFNNKGQYNTSDILPLDAFQASLKKEKIQTDIAKKRKESSGNYDAMFGTVTNFTYDLNQEGGFDCTVRLIGLGSVIDSIRINQTYVMPTKLQEKLSQAQLQLARKQYEADKQKAIDDARAKTKAAEAEYNKTYPIKTVGDILSKAFPSVGGVTTTNSTIRSLILGYGVYPLNEPGPLTSAARVDFVYNNSYFKTPVTDEKNITLTTPVIQYIQGVTKVDLDLEVINKAALLNRGTSAKKSPYKTDIVDLAYTNLLNSYDTIEGFKADFGARLDAKGIERLNSIAFKSTSLKVSGRAETATYRFVLPQTGFSTSTTAKDVLDALDITLSNNVTVGFVYYSDGAIRSNRSFYMSLPTQVINNQSVIINFETNSVEAFKSGTEKNRPEIQPILPTPPPSLGSGVTNNTKQTTGTAQTTNSNTTKSSLQAMLEAVKSLTLVSLSKDIVITYPLFELTNIMFNSSVLNGFISNGGVLNGAKYPQAIRGYNTNLLAGIAENQDIPAIDSTLFHSYLIRYQTTNVSGVSEPQSAVYIKLGYLLAFMNSMCLLYDTEQDGAQSTQRPYVYIDFNPETNFCLTTTKHLSIDPTKCIIPFQGSDGDYQDIFKESAAQPQDIFTPSTQDTISAKLSKLSKFQTTTSNTGKTMNILLNVDYLRDLVSKFATQDEEAGAVYLRPFLDNLVADINKSLGNFNMFRVGYNDDANTVVIYDDQYVPTSLKEPNGISNKDDISEISIYGVNSLTRGVTFKTDISTKMSNQIAISAQSVENASSLSVDATPFAHLNKGFTDRYIKRKAEVSVSPNQTVNQAVIDTKKNLAELFNTHVRSIYGNLNINSTQIEGATNFYIQAMSKIKAKNPLTQASAFIPVSATITIDGIGGVLMGNVFKIPENRLPISLKGNKIGFIVAGLNHILEGGYWTTEIRGQIIKLKFGITSTPSTQSTTQTQVVGTTTSKASYPVLGVATYIPVSITDYVARVKATLQSNGLTDKNIQHSIVAIAINEQRVGNNITGPNYNRYGVMADIGKWGSAGTKYIKGAVTATEGGTGSQRYFAAFNSEEDGILFMYNKLAEKGFQKANTSVVFAQTYVSKWWGSTNPTQQELQQKADGYTTASKYLV
jgi:hypothetical protein